MPKKAASKEEIELVFGLKQILGTALVASLLLGGAYMLGYERGHKRASEGKPSLLALLERSSGLPDSTVPIPDFLLNSDADGPLGARDPAREPDPVEVRETSPAPVVGSKPVTDRSSEAKQRVKPQPSIKPKAPAAKDPERPSMPASRKQDQPVPAVSSRRLHYQVAALSRRQNAKKLADWLRNEGFLTTIQPAADDGLFRVLIGPFRNDRDAQSARDRLSKDGFQLMARRF